MKIARLVASLPFVAVAAFTSPAAAQADNLLVNGRFETGLSGWSRTTNVSWSSAFGGAALIEQTLSSGTEVLAQCVPVTGGSLYELAAAANLPRRTNGDGSLSVRVRWLDAPACRERVLGGGLSLDFSASDETRQTRSRLLVSPPGAESAIVLLVASADVDGTYSFVVDDVSFKPDFAGEVLTLPSAASAPGALGQRWQTDLWVRNSAAAPRRFSARMLCPAPCGPSPEWISLNLGPLETRFLPDVVADVFGGWQGRAGAIELAYDPRDGGLEAFARVATANAENPGNGTAIPALPRDARRAQANFIGLSGLGGNAGFRVNVGAFNPNDGDTAVTIFVRDGAGRTLGSVERTWAPREWFQVNDILRKTGVSTGDAASIFVDSGLPLFPFVIAVDNRSGDPTWLAPAPDPQRP